MDDVCFSGVCGVCISMNFTTSKFVFYRRIENEPVYITILVL